MSFKKQHENYVRPKNICGIYIIINNINNKKYIGKSNNIKRRIQEHMNPYEQKRTPNKPLYLAFNKYGIENFSFDILEECDKEKLNQKERYWIAYYHSDEPEYGYNILSGGDGHEPDEKHPNHKLTKEDVIDIRTRYANHERKKEVEKLYEDKIGHSGFTKVWKGTTWSDIMPEVYTKENKNFHKHNTGQKGSENGRSILSEKDVYNIRLSKKQGLKLDDVYELYKNTGIKKSTFEFIWYDGNWKHIKVE